MSQINLIFTFFLEEQRNKYSSILQIRNINPKLINISDNLTSKKKMLNFLIQAKPRSKGIPVQFYHFKKQWYGTGYMYLPLSSSSIDVLHMQENALRKNG